MKFLVNRKTSEVSGGFKNFPDSNISGAFVVDVPFDDFEFNPTGLTIYEQKYARLDSYVGTLFDFVSSGRRIYSEFIDNGLPSSTGIEVETTYSSRYSHGPGRRYILRPSGYINLQDSGFIPFSFGAQPVNFYVTYNAYSEVYIPRDSTIPWGAPDHQIRLGFNPATDITFDLIDSVGNLLQSLSYGRNTPDPLIFSAYSYPLDFYVRMTNMSVKDLILSDFSLYWNY